MEAFDVIVVAASGILFGTTLGFVIHDQFFYRPMKQKLQALTAALKESLAQTDRAIKIIDKWERLDRERPVISPIQLKK